MSFCNNCGKQLSDEDKFCPSCGKPVEPVTGGNAPTDGEQAGTNGATPDFSCSSTSFEDFTNAADKTDEFDAADIRDNKVYAILSYIGILVLVPLIAAPNSKFARFHANQGLVLLIGEIAFNIVRTVLLSVLKISLRFSILSVLYSVISIVTGILNLIFAVFAIIGIIYAAQGRAKELPIVSKINLLK